MAQQTHPKFKQKTPLLKDHSFDGVIFDIDNVLIDTRHSYLDAIRNTVEIYLTQGPVPFFSHSASAKFPSLLSPEDVDQFKLLGGFNDDWDCCYGLLIYLLSLPVQKRNIDDLRKSIDLGKFSKTIKQRPLRVSGITALLGRPSTVMIEKIARIFQEVYLGKDLFPILTKNRMKYWKKRGLIHKEKLVFKKPLLQKIKDRGIKLGISTGRSFYEAMFALKRFGISELFDALTTMDEVKKAEREKKESLRKPHPFSLIQTAKKIGAKKKFLYIGDLPDDILAANQAKEALSICSAGFTSLASNPFQASKEMEQVQPDFSLKTPSDLASLLKL